MIRIEKRTTTFDAHGGVYPITVELTEYIDGVYMPPRRYDFNLTIGKKLTPEEYLPKQLKIDDQTDSSSATQTPQASISEFFMNGNMRITFSKPIAFPDDLKEKFNQISS